MPRRYLPRFPLFDLTPIIFLLLLIVFPLGAVALLFLWIFCGPVAEH